MLAFPNFDLPFELYTDTSDYQIRACLIQRKGYEFPIGYFARKFNYAQSKYTVTENELLSIVEGLTHFRTIIYRYRITAQTDHKKISYENSDYSSGRILRQRLVIEEYGTEIKYIPGIKNTTSDSLLRIPSRAQPDQENYALGDTITKDDKGFTLNLNHIADEQKTCSDLIERLQSKQKYLHQTHLRNDIIRMHRG